MTYYIVRDTPHGPRYAIAESHRVLRRLLRLMRGLGRLRVMRVH